MSLRCKVCRDYQKEETECRSISEELDEELERRFRDDAAGPEDRISTCRISQEIRVLPRTKVIHLEDALSQLAAMMRSIWLPHLTR